MEKKKSILLLISAILGCAYLIYSIVYWTGINSGSSSSAESIGFGIATAIVFPHLIATAVAFIFNLLGWIMNHKWFALTGAILYTVALLLFPLYFMFVIAEMILSYVGFARMSGREKQPQQARPQQPAPKITQNELGDLNSKQLVYADAMVRYCKHFGFDNGLTGAACKELFAEAERHVAPDTEVVMAFVARYPVESNVPCACAFAVHKLIIAARDNILELPTDQIKEISLAGDGSSEKLLIRCGEISYELGVDAAHAGSILDFLRRSKDACMVDIRAEVDKMSQSSSPATRRKVKTPQLIAVIVVIVCVFAGVYYLSQTGKTANHNDVSTETAPLPSESIVPSQNVSDDDATLGEQNALVSANSYLTFSAFSAQSLADQLEFEGYTTQEAQYAIAKCGADWNEQALKKAESYLDTSAFSYSGLFDQLSYEGFLPEEAQYGVDNCNADWNEQAAKKAESYLNVSSFSREELIDQLLYEGFTQDQAEYGVTAVGY